MKTCEATLLNNNISQDWNGFASLIPSADGNITGVICSMIEQCLALVTLCHGMRYIEI